MFKGNSRSTTKTHIDRMLIAQALYEQIPIVSLDPQLDAYGVTRIW
jgi:PIN domain nuclease of toxin-antitoxin system